MKLLATCLFAGVAFAMTAGSLPAAEKVMTGKVKSIKGDDVDLSKYQGKVVLIVNVASACGNTPQYTQLESLNKKYKEKGLEVLGFPCNQFGAQEPKSESDIAKFCSDNYHVTFDMFSKVNVNGDDAAPLYKALTAKDNGPMIAGKVTWNFEKFLVNRNGEVIARFKPGMKPDAPEIVAAIESELAKSK